MNKSELIAIRDYIPEDRNFILSTFLIGLYYGDSWFSEVPKQVFMENYHKVITHILDAPTTKVNVACLKEDHSTILGYSILVPSASALHWVYIKKAWRNIGIARDLVPSSTKTATHLTKLGLSILKKKSLVFNPFNL